MGGFNLLSAVLNLDVTNFQSGANAAVGTIGELGDRFESVSTTLEGIKGKLEAAFATGVIVEFGKIALEAAMEFDTAMATISRRVGDAGGDIKELGQTFEETFSSIPESADQVAQAMSLVIARTGETGEALSNLIVQLSQLSRFTGSDFQATVAGAVRVFAQWKVATDDQSGALNMLYTAAQKAGLSATQLIDPLVQYGAQLRELGLSLQQATALIGSFAKAGLDFSDVSRGISKALAEAAKSGQDAGQMFQGYVDAIQGADKATANLIAESLVGAKAYAPFVDAIKSGTFSIQEFSKSLTDSQKSLADTDKQTRTLSETWTLFTKTLDDPLKLIGEDMTRVFTGFINDVLKPASAEILVLVQAFESLSPGTRDFIIDMGLILTAVVPATFAISALSAAVKSLAIGEFFAGGFSAAIGYVRDLITYLGGAAAAIGTVEIAVGLLGAAITTLASAILGLKAGEWLTKEFLPGFTKALNDGADAFDRIIPGFKALDDAFKKAATWFVPDTVSQSLDKQVQTLANYEIVIDKTGLSQDQYSAKIKAAVANLAEYQTQTDAATAATKAGADATDASTKAQSGNASAIANTIKQIAGLKTALTAVGVNVPAQGAESLSQYLQTLQKAMSDYTDSKFWSEAENKQKLFTANATSMWAQLGQAVFDAQLKVGLFMQGIEEVSKNQYELLKPPDVSGYIAIEDETNRIAAALAPIPTLFTAWGEELVLVNGRWVDAGVEIQKTGGFLEQLNATAAKTLDMLMGMGQFQYVFGAAATVVSEMALKFDAMTLSINKAFLTSKDLVAVFSNLGVTPVQKLVDGAKLAEDEYTQLAAVFKSQTDGMNATEAGFAKQFTVYTNDMVAAWISAETKRQQAAIATGQVISAQEADNLTRAKEWYANMIAQAPTVRDAWVGAMKTVDTAVSQTFSQLEDGLASAITGSGSFKDAFTAAAQSIEKAFAEFVIKGVFDTLKNSMAQALKDSDGLTLSFQNLIKVLTGKTVSIPGLGGLPATGGGGGENGGLNSGAYDPVLNPGGTGGAAAGAGTLGGVGSVVDALGGLGVAIGLVMQAIQGIVQGVQMARLINLTGEIEVTTRSTFNQVFSIQGTLNTWLPYLGGIQNALQGVTDAFTGGQDEGMNIKDVFNSLATAMQQISSFFPTVVPMPGAAFTAPPIADSNTYLYSIAQNMIVAAGVLTTSINTSLGAIANSTSSMDAKMSAAPASPRLIQIFVDATNKGDAAAIAEAFTQALQANGITA